MKSWVCALAILLACTEPLSSRAYTEYVPPRPLAERQKVESIKINATGYYAPLKGQKKYATGNYQKEVRLNGSGKFTSSGVPPKIGTIAADLDHYPYGTMVLIKERNVIGIVQDTGSAIKGKYRMDVFCGWGDQGLREALTWDKDVPVTVEIIFMPKKTG